MAEAVLSGIITEIHGSLAGFVFRNTRNGTIIAKSPARGSGVPTQEQAVARTFFTTASKAWRDLSDAQRDAWGSYATAYFPQDKDGRGSGPVGQAVFLNAYWHCLLKGAGVPSVPGAAPPSAVTAITMDPASAQDEIVARITHGYTTLTGLRVFVEITPTMLSAARHPQVSQYRAIVGLTANSIPALAASGNAYTFSGIRYDQAEDALFGISATIVDAFGIPSRPFRLRTSRAIS